MRNIIKILLFLLASTVYSQEDTVIVTTPTFEVEVSSNIPSATTPTLPVIITKAPETFRPQRAKGYKRPYSNRRDRFYRESELFNPYMFDIKSSEFRSYFDQRCRRK